MFHEKQVQNKMSITQAAADAIEYIVDRYFGEDTDFGEDCKYDVKLNSNDNRIKIEVVDTILNECIFCFAIVLNNYRRFKICASSDLADSPVGDSIYDDINTELNSDRIVYYIA